MKKIVNKICSLAAVTLLLAACTDIEHDTATLDAIEQARNTLTQATAYDLGVTNVAGDSAAYSLRLASSGISVDYVKTSSGAIADNAYKGTGYVILINSLFAPLPDDDNFPIGTFDIEKDFESIYSIVLHNGSTAAAAEKVRAVSGTVVITKSVDKYTVAINATNINDAKLEVSYTGAIDVAKAVYYGESLTASTHTFVIDGFSFAVKNEYNRTGQATGSLSTLTLTGPEGLIVIDDIAGPPYKIGEEPTQPAAGTYTLTEWTYDENSFTPGVIDEGELTGSYAWLLASATPSFSEMWYFVSAEMVVTDTDEAYTIKVTATSANGSAIEATYEKKKAE